MKVVNFIIITSILRMLGKTKFHISLTPSSAFSDSLRDGSLKIIWYTFYHFTFRSGQIKKRLFRNFRHSPRARPRFQSSPRGSFPGTRCPSATTPKYSDKIKNSIKYFHSSLFSLFLSYSRPRPIAWPTVCPNFDPRTRWRIDWVDFRYLTTERI